MHYCLCNSRVRPSLIWCRAAVSCMRVRWCRAAVSCMLQQGSIAKCPKPQMPAPKSLVPGLATCSTQLCHSPQDLLQMRTSQTACMRTFSYSPSRLNFPVTTPMLPVMVSGCASSCGAAMPM